MTTCWMICRLKIPTLSRRIYEIACVSIYLQVETALFFFCLLGFLNLLQKRLGISYKQKLWTENCFCYDVHHSNPFVPVTSCRLFFTVFSLFAALLLLFGQEAYESALSVWKENTKNTFLSFALAFYACVLLFFCTHKPRTRGGMWHYNCIAHHKHAPRMMHLKMHGIPAQKMPFFGASHPPRAFL